MQILMLSSSRVNNCAYLADAKPMIMAHLSTITDCLFIPYAGITMSYDEYTDTVQQALPDLSITGIHTYADPQQAIQTAKAILVGGGNTFELLHQIQTQGLVEVIQDVVKHNTPYIGWSAGSNICGATIRTTNDMPIVEPASFSALNFVPCQLNPHYTDEHPVGFHGETRDQRLSEFVTLQPHIPVIGIREGSALLLDETDQHQPRLTLVDGPDGILYSHAHGKQIIASGSDLSAYLK